MVECAETYEQGWSGRWDERVFVDWWFVFDKIIDIEEW